ncbi:MAG: hypothetical protein A4E57_02137 [Syntrophorhabdaceae bacterium PtaU1.Bin034]|nr:MAG: hypothetical protein A4E57_02137 [Syntrophorhabdaceae bacterium PtaU1.Bin034]
MEQERVESDRERNDEMPYRTRLHWIMFFGPGGLMMIGGLSIPSKGLPAAVILALGTIWGIFSSINFERSEIVLSRSSLRLRVGGLWRRSYDIPLSEIERVDVYQPSLGKILDFGKITIRRKNARKLVFRMIRSPLQLAGKIYQYKSE